MGILSQEATQLLFASLLSRGQFLKERICSPRTKFFPLRVDPNSKSSQFKELSHPEKPTELHGDVY